MLVTRSKPVEEDWKVSKTTIDIGDDHPHARIKIDMWDGRIACYGYTVVEAGRLRDFIMRAVEAYDGV